MLKELYHANEALIKKIAFIAGFILLVYFFLTTLFGYIAPFVIGYLFSLIMEPLVGLCEKRLKMKRWLLALLSVVLLLVVVGGIGASIVSRITSEVIGLQESLPTYVEQYSASFNELMATLRDMAEFVPDEVQSFVTGSGQTVAAQLSSLLGEIAKSGSVSLVSGLPMLVMNTLLMLISSYFFIKDKHLIAGSVRKYSPHWVRTGVGTIKTGFFKAFVSYVKAQLIIMSVTTSVAVLGLTIMRSPYSLLLGILIGFVDALPIFGSGAILWPWAVGSLIMGNYSFSIGLMVVYAAIFLTRQLLEPKVLSSQIGLHPILTLLAIYAGLKLFGTIGLIAGPVILVTAKIILSDDEPGAVSSEPAPPEPPPSQT